MVKGHSCASLLLTSRVKTSLCRDRDGLGININKLNKITLKPFNE